jgi:hypothetical protein
MWKRLWPVIVVVVVVVLASWWVFSRGDDFYVTDENWDRGVARRWPGYYVPLESRVHAAGRVVKLGNGEKRRITQVVPHGPYLHVHLAGKPLDQKVHGYPKDYRIEDGPASPGGEDPFIITDANWDRSVARRWAGFVVSAEKSGLAQDRTVVLKNGEPRKVLRVEQKGPYLNVYLDGPRLDPAVHGIPPEYTLK